MQKNRIYQLWWQGIERAPDIVKICHESLLRNYNPRTQEIVMLDKENIFQYIELPEYIIRKFEENVISLTHLSDIVRSALLKETGGLWVDATIFFASQIPDEWFHSDFFTMKNPLAKINDITSKWECFLIAGKKDFPLFSLLNDFWMEYWKNENDLITYLLSDHIFYIAYKENRRVRTAIDKCPKFYYRIDFFQQIANNKYVDKKYREMITHEPFIKMTYKLSLREKTRSGKLTYYGKLVEEYLK